MVKLLAFALCAATAGAGCTSQQVYESTRALRVDQCQQLPPPEREDCMHQTHETQPERERREQEAELPR